MAEGRTVSDARPTQEEEDGQSSPKKQLNRHLRPKPPAGVSVRPSALSEYTHTYVCAYVGECMVCWVGLYTGALGMYTYVHMYVCII